MLHKCRNLHVSQWIIGMPRTPRSTYCVFLGTTRSIAVAFQLQPDIRSPVSVAPAWCDIGSISPRRRSLAAV
eukprot:9352895-Pyramimonas_sp.AAC.1